MPLSESPGCKSQDSRTSQDHIATIHAGRRGSVRVIPHDAVRDQKLNGSVWFSGFCKLGNSIQRVKL